MSLLGADTKSVLLYVFCSSLRSGLLESGETVSFNGGGGETGRDVLCSAQVRGSVCLALQRYVRLTTYGGPPATPPGPPPPLRVASPDRPTRPNPYCHNGQRCDATFVERFASQYRQFPNRRQ